MPAYNALLLGRNEVPPVATPAFGTAVFHYDEANRRIRFRLEVQRITRMTQAHIHLGRPGQNGPVVAFLFGPSAFGISTGRGIVRGTLSARHLVGPLQGRTIRDLVRELNSGNAYVNVHTVQRPNGEIRGQIRRIVVR